MAKGKRGRPRKAGIRATSGRLSRAADAHQENLDPILTRMRLFGLTEKDARDQKAATFVGRLQLMKVISQAQYDAAVAWLALRDSYKRAIGAPDALKSSGGATGGTEETVEHTAWCHRAIRQYDAAMAAVTAEQCLHQNRGGNLYGGLDYVVGRDEQHWHMVGDARLALNALAHHFGLMRKGKAPVIDKPAEAAA